MATTYILNDTHSIANHMLKALRDKTIQKDRMRFRQNVEHLGAVMAYEISKKLRYQKQSVVTPLGKSTVYTLLQQPVLITVLRAGLPYFQGFQQFFDEADCGFIGAYRKEGEEEVTISLNYVAAPSLEGCDLILIDPMLATGKSFVKSLDALLKYGKPSHVHIAALVAAPEGLEFLNQNVKQPFTIWTWAVDEKLDEHAYIVPGLGDAGDLCYGEKL